MYQRSLYCSSGNLWLRDVFTLRRKKGAILRGNAPRDIALKPVAGVVVILSKKEKVKVGDN